MYDYIVIGGGIAGLYFAMNCPGKCLVLEKDDHLGGRTQTEIFHGVPISLGAGIGVANRDYLLIDLINRFKIDYHVVDSGIYNDENYQILKKLLSKVPDNNDDFETFMESVLTPDEIRSFIIGGGYTDYLKANAYTTMLYYGLDDNCTNFYAIIFNWTTLIERMASQVNYQLGKKVVQIYGEYPEFRVIVNHDEIYLTKNVVIAGTISTINSLLDYPMYQQIAAQPFLRVYGYFNNINATKMRRCFPHTKIVDSIVHKIIPMKDNVWMVAYTDGDDALELYDQLENLDIILSDIAGEDIVIEDIRVIFWKEGTHYYLPGESIDFEKLQNPAKGIYVIGEVVSRHQGWCLGALESTLIHRPKDVNR